MKRFLLILILLVFVGVTNTFAHEWQTITYQYFKEKLTKEEQQKCLEWLDKNDRSKYNSFVKQIKQDRKSDAEKKKNELINSLKKDKENNKDIEEYNQTVPPGYYEKTGDAEGALGMYKMYTLSNGKKIEVREYVKVGENQYYAKDWSKKTPEERTQIINNQQKLINREYAKQKPGEYLNGNLQKITNKNVKVNKETIKKGKNSVINAVQKQAGKITEKQKESIKKAVDQYNHNSTEQGQEEINRKIEMYQAQADAFDEWCQKLGLECNANKK